MSTLNGKVALVTGASKGIGAGIAKDWLRRAQRSHDARKDGKGVLGVYDLDGDTLKVTCVVGQWKGKEWVGKPRPKGFDSKQADVVIELKRVKSGK